MDYSMLEMMCEEYLNNSMDFVKYTKTEAEKKFGEKYIKPEIKKNPHSGMEMEEMFSSALADSAAQNFINGFKTCMYLIAECFEKRSLKTDSGDIEA